MSTPETPAGRIRIDYIKSNCFRVVHVDGIFGGISPRGQIHIDFFSERPPIPQHIVHAIEDSKTLGPEDDKERRVRDADVIREVEVGVTLDLELSKALMQWLGDKISALEKLHQLGK